ncbi:MAG: type II toxin-antitoxin system death-on-curing family toxin [Sphingomonadales bacterium]
MTAPSPSPIWLEEAEALVFHDRLLALHGGPGGVRDRGLLQAALARPRQHAAYGGAPDMPHLAAIYADGIIKSHPFVDGNKRTGFLLGILFLELNGYVFRANQADAANAVINLAAGEIDVQAFAAFLRDHAAPLAPSRDR